MYNYALKINTFSISTILVVFLAILLFTYIGLVANMVRGGYYVEDLIDRISVAEKMSSTLQIQLSEASSLDYILMASDDLSYTEIDKISYIKKESLSPFALNQ